MIINVYLLLTVTVALVYCSNSPNNRHRRGIIMNVFIPTTHGKMMGMTERWQGTNASTIMVDVFWGIPYAKPPVGNLRFKRPEPSENWTTSVFNARTLPNSCFQVRDNDSILVGNTPTPMSEDCLYLNIWRPKCFGASHKMATMVWIYGGFFMTGSTADPVYNGASLAAFECVIVASVNYRLGAFGFLYLDSEEVPGNMGLLDVALAVKWIKNNVGSFNGNPDRITLFGNSAGAAIASMFLFSPLTRDLFNNVIIQSGNPFNKFFHQSTSSALSAASKLAKMTNCNSSDVTAVAQCLRQVSAIELSQMQAYLTVTDFTYSMGPVTDRYFLTQDPIDSVFSRDFKNCSIMIGTTKDEGTFVLTQVMPKDYKFSLQNPPALSDEHLTLVMAGLFKMVLKENYVNNFTSLMRIVYDYDKLKKQVANPSLTLLNNILRDFIFVCPANTLAHVYGIFSIVYMYSYNYVPEYTTLPDWVGATHGSEVPVVFNTTTRAFPMFSPRDAQMNEQIMNMWGNFAKYGNPTPSPTIRPQWPIYTRSDGSIMVFENETRRILADELIKNCNYWYIPRDYLIL